MKVTSLSLYKYKNTQMQIRLKLCGQYTMKSLIKSSKKKLNVNAPDNLRPADIMTDLKDVAFQVWIQQLDKTWENLHHQI